MKNHHIAKHVWKRQTDPRLLILPQKIYTEMNRTFRAEKRYNKLNKNQNLTCLENPSNIDF
jgi:hypothetical protein